MQRAITPIAFRVPLLGSMGILARRNLVGQECPTYILVFDISPIAQVEPFNIHNSQSNTNGYAPSPSRDWFFEFAENSRSGLEIGV